VHGLFGIGMDQRKAMPAMRQFWLAVRSQALVGYLTIPDGGCGG
jgi:hypothetical protein